MLQALATMTRVGSIAPGSMATRTVTGRLHDAKLLARAGLHPIAYLAAKTAYESGHGVRGHYGWRPVDEVVGALDHAFRATIPSVRPTGRRMVLAEDLPRSIAERRVAGVPGLTFELAGSALARISAAVEPSGAELELLTPRVIEDVVRRAVSNQGW
jgi:60 kDa SS-A/Ro ribonucleoprotein